MQLWREAMKQVWDSDVSEPVVSFSSTRFITFEPELALLFTKQVPLLQKIYLNVFFFGTRLFATHIVSFVFYCTLVPICVIAPEVAIPYWALVYVPILVTISTIAFTPR